MPSERLMQERLAGFAAQTEELILHNRPEFLRI